MKKKWGEEYDTYYEKIYYWALNKTRNKEDALDLTNDIFVAIFQYINKSIKVEKMEKNCATYFQNMYRY